MLLSESKPTRDLLRLSALGPKVTSSGSVKEAPSLRTEKEGKSTSGY